MKYLSSEFHINSDTYAKTKSLYVPAYKFFVFIIHNSQVKSKTVSNKNYISTTEKYFMWEYPSFRCFIQLTFTVETLLIL
jgi:hypothetical protein